MCQQLSVRSQKKVDCNLQKQAIFFGILSTAEWHSHFRVALWGFPGGCVKGDILIDRLQRTGPFHAVGTGNDLYRKPVGHVDSFELCLDFIKQPGVAATCHANHAHYWTVQ